MTTTQLTDERLIAQLFDTQPDSVVWFKPVFAIDHKIADFEVKYCNTAACKLLNAPRPTILNHTLLTTPLMDDVTKQRIFEQCSQVWNTGEAMEFTYHSPIFDSYFNVQRSKVQDGILSITRDRTPWVRAELEKDNESWLLHKLVDNSPYGVSLYQSIRNREGKIVDFKLRLCNNKAAEIAEFTVDELYKLTIKDIINIRNGQAIFFDLATEVVETGLDKTMEYRSEAKDKWLSVSIVKFEDGFLLNYIDVTQTKLLEQQAKEQADLLNSIVQNTLNGLYYYQAIRRNGQIEDFQLKFCNDGALRQSTIPEQQLKKLTLKQVQLLRNTPDFLQQCIDVVETGKPAVIEHYSRHADKWFNMVVTKCGDGFVTNAYDVTAARKQAMLLESVLTASITALFSMEAIRDENEAVVDFRFTRINKTFTQILGLTEEIIGKSYLSVFPTAKELGLFDLHVQVLNTGESLKTEFYYQAQGIKGWYSISISKMGANGVVQSFTEITDLVESRNALESAAADLQEIIDSAQTAITLLTPIKNEQGAVTDFSIKIANKTSSKYIGKEPEELKGSRLVQMFPGVKETGLFDTYKNVFDTGEPARFEIHYDHDGLDIWADVAVKKHGEDLLITYHDLTSLKNLQLELEQKLRELQRSNQNLEEFSYAASHDLQEPLRKVTTFLNRIKDNLQAHFDDTSALYFERIEVSVERMKNLIDDLLQFSHASFKPEAFAKVSLQEVVHDVLNDMEVVLIEKKAKLNIGQLPQINGISRQLKQLFQNLLSNSLKYTRDGVVPEISISSTLKKGSQLGNVAFRLDSQKNYIELKLTDNGIGFEQVYAEKIFQLFQRLHAKNEYSGSGIGLAIVKKVVENHNGYIVAEGKPGEGACFTIYLPQN